MSYQTGEFPVLSGGQNVGSVSVSQNGLMTVFDSGCDYESPDVLRLAAVCDGRYVALGVMMPDKAGALRLKKSYSKNGLAEIGFSGPVSYHLVRQGDVFKENATSPKPAENRTSTPTAVRPVRRPSASSHDMKPESQPAEEQRAPSFTLPAAHAQMQPLHRTQPQMQPQSPVQTPAEKQLQATEEKITPATPGSEQHASDKVKEEEAPSDLKPTGVDGWVPADDPRALFRDGEFAEICRDVKNALTKQSGDTVLLAVPVSPDEPFTMMPVFCFGDSGKIGGRDYIIFKIKNGKLSL